MNVREEDRQKNNCPSRGLGLAAAAIGVGVGAALYYFFSKRPENPDAGGSTTQWSCEQPHAFNPLHDSEETDSYITISENSTTDTSIFTSDNTDTEMMDTSDEETSYDDDSDRETSNVDSQSSNVSLNVEDLFGTIETPSFSNVINIESDPDTFDYDVTDSSIGVPDGAMLPPSPLLRLIENFGSYLSPRSQQPEKEQMINAKRSGIVSV
ncbi:hypothetical protein evm_008987 [Chilo suppressalis]|nr:hypothetical protein evm_008987 [Chilo suppressalis]